MSNLPEKVSHDQLQKLIDASSKQGIEVVNAEALAAVLIPLIATLDDVDKKLEALLSDGILPERWSYFIRGRRSIRNGLRQIKRSIKV